MSRFGVVAGDSVSRRSQRVEALSLPFFRRGGLVSGRVLTNLLSTRLQVQAWNSFYNYHYNCTFEQPYQFSIRTTPAFHPNSI